MPKTSLNFNILVEDKLPPELTDFVMISITQTTAQAYFSTSDMAVAYYCLALRGTEVPNYQELKSLGPNHYPTTKKQYGVYYLDKS